MTKKMVKELIYGKTAPNMLEIFRMTIATDMDRCSGKTVVSIKGSGLMEYKKIRL